VTSHVVSVVVQWNEPGADVTTNSVVGLAPTVAPLCQVTVALPSPGTACTATGDAGGPIGVTVEEGADVPTRPLAFSAVTVAL
jgi:hypothetical protein